MSTTHVPQRALCSARLRHEVAVRIVEEPDATWSGVSVVVDAPPFLGAHQDWPFAHSLDVSAIGPLVVT